MRRGTSGARRWLSQEVIGYEALEMGLSSAEGAGLRLVRWGFAASCYAAVASAQPIGPALRQGAVVLDLMSLGEAGSPT